MEQTRTRVPYLTSDQFRKKTRRDLDIELDRFIGDLQRLGSSLQQTANTKERERDAGEREGERRKEKP
ncbi:hypothetical protein F2Q68_00001770 [Brassica cretica]|uniref:Uncharacterized protein n=1 Tax=Brassica cretica TaxID=69181 RepID=A0A8S9J604_BRACR|nr:hypothetical protein F2Q68_00001770 [Brassica cretica]